MEQGNVGSNTEAKILKAAGPDKIVYLLQSWQRVQPKFVTPSYIIYSKFFKNLNAIQLNARTWVTKA